MEDGLIWNTAEQQGPVLILAHGAGAGMNSDFMEIMTEYLCHRGITVVRFEFPYMQERRVTGKKRPPDRQPTLIKHWVDTVVNVRHKEPSRPLFIGGKSMGGRMATLLTADPLGCEGLSGVVCLGYPFYAAGKQDKPRIAHLSKVSVPHLIVQGERDTMGNKTAVDEYELSGAIDFCWLQDGNHDLKPRKVSGFTHCQHLESAAEAITAFIKVHC